MQQPDEPEMQTSEAVSYQADKYQPIIAEQWKGVAVFSRGTGGTGAPGSDSTSPLWFQEQTSDLLSRLPPPENRKQRINRKSMVPP